MKDIIYLAFLILSISLILILSLTNPIKNYLRRYRYAKIIHTINALYADINAFLLSQEEREQILAPELYYGEMDLCAFLDLMAIIKPKANQRFYDLGSGGGKLVIAAKMRYPSLRCFGIELLKSLNKISHLKYQALIAKQAVAKEGNVTFLQGNFLKADLNEADIVFINATGFTPTTFPAVCEKLLLLKARCKIIITSKQLPQPQFKKIYQGTEKTSWGFTSTFIYERMG